MNIDNITYILEFKRDLKKLKKKFRSLDEDLESFINTAIKLFYAPDQLMGIVRISELGIDEPKIFKARKFACKSLKGSGSRSGIRVIFAQFEDKRIEMIEIYFKGDKENEDRERIIERYGK